MKVDVAETTILASGDRVGAVSEAMPPLPTGADGEDGDERWRYGPPADAAAGGAAAAESYAPWWRRLVAYVLDALLLGAPTALIGFQLDLLKEVESGDFVRYEPEPGLVLISLVGLIVYSALMDGGPRGATIGKMAMKIQVRDAQTGGPIGPARAALRRLVYLLLFYAYVLPGIANVLSPLWDRRSQGWHDKAARSVVVNSGA